MGAGVAGVASEDAVVNQDMRAISQNDVKPHLGVTAGIVRLVAKEITRRSNWNKFCAIVINGFVLPRRNNRSVLDGRQNKRLSQKKAKIR